MSLPSAMMPPGYAQTLAEIRTALESRIRNATQRLSVVPAYHRGTPDAGALPKEPLSVWLDWTDIVPDTDEPNEATMLVSIWLVSIIGHDTGPDPFGSEVPAAERVWGEILTILTEDVTDLGLDGACDFVPTPNVRQFRGNLSSGDQGVVVIQMEVQVHHQQELFRPNPAP